MGRVSAKKARVRESVARRKFSGSRRIDEADLDPLILQRIGEEVPGAAIEIGRGDDIVADPREILHGEGRGRLTGRDAERRGAAFERGEALFENVGGGIAQPRVNIAQFLQREEIGGVFGVAELVAGGLVDRRRHGAGGRIGPPAGVKDNGLGPLGFDRHGVSSNLSFGRCGRGRQDCDAEGLSGKMRPKLNRQAALRPLVESLICPVPTRRRWPA